MHPTHLTAAGLLPSSDVDRWRDDAAGANCLFCRGGPPAAPERRHSTWRLSWVREGQVTFESRGERLRLVPGRLLVLGPETPHAVLAEGRTPVVEYFQLDLDADATGALPLPLLRLLPGYPNLPSKLLAASQLGRQASLRAEWGDELRDMLERLPNHARPSMEPSKWAVDLRSLREADAAPIRAPRPPGPPLPRALEGRGHGDALALALRDLPERPSPARRGARRAQARAS